MRITQLQQRLQSKSPYLFLNQHRRPLSVSGVQFRLKQYCQQAGVQLSCHQLRHTFARRLVEHNMPIDSLAKLLGHQPNATSMALIRLSAAISCKRCSNSLNYLNPNLSQQTMFLTRSHLVLQGPTSDLIRKP